jgi:hypothetical protein
MVTRGEVQNALLDRILKQSRTAQAPELLQLAEALAWLTEPNQTHGSTRSQAEQSAPVGHLGGSNVQPRVLRDSYRR